LGKNLPPSEKKIVDMYSGVHAVESLVPHFLWELSSMCVIAEADEFSSWI
jgi:hypothetical protein